MDPVPPVLEFAPKPKTNILVWIIGGIIIFGVGIWIGLFLAKDIYPPLQILPTPTPSPIAIVDPTANWKTLTSKKYLYTINLPPDWEKLVGPPEEEYFNIRKGNYEIGLSILPTTKTTIQGYLTESDKESSTAWEGKPSTKVLSTRLTKIGNYNVARREEEWLAAGFSKPVLNTYFLNGGFIYRFTLKYIGPITDSSIVGDDTYDQILSTFKFVGQNVDLNIDDVFNKIRTADTTIRWSAVTTTDTFRYPGQNGIDLPVQKISFTATGKEDFNKVNKIVDILKEDGWKLDNDDSASGVGASYESYIKNIKGVNYLLVFGFNNSNIWFAMSKI